MSPPAFAAAEAPGRARLGSARPISLLIVDDSLVVRTLLGRILAARPEFVVAGAAASVKQALHILEKAAVDVILLDVEMPETDGLTALPRLIERGRGARILMVSALCDSGAAASVRAMTLGAADALLKPKAGSFGMRFEEQLIERLLRIGRAAPTHHPPAGGQHGSTESLHLRPVRTEPLEILAIGASTGGLHALSALFHALSRSVRVPIAITQHLPSSFMPYFAAQMAELAQRPCTVAQDGQPLRAGSMLVAPGTAHLRIVRMDGTLVVRLDHDAVPNGHMPSADPMFASIGEASGSGAMGVMLSGMGRDGASGASAMVEAGGELLAQDAASSVVWGMPGAVARAGLASTVAAPASLAARIAARVEGLA